MLFTTLAMAVRELRRNATRSILTALGIVIGVAAVISLVTLGEAATAKITNDIGKLGKDLLFVTPGTSQRGPTSVSSAALTSADASAILRDVSAAAAVAPVINRGQLVVFGSANANTTITGTTNAFFKVRAFSFARGRQFSEIEMLGGPPVCVLGDTVRRTLFRAQHPIDATIRIGRISCRVIGVLTPKGSGSIGGDQDDLVVLPMLTVQRRLTGSSDLTMIYVSAAEGQTSRAKAQIEQLMRERRRITKGQSDDFSVQDMREITNTLGQVTSVLIALLGAVAAVSLLVGGIGIMNIMLVSVTERTREIGIRLSIGALGSEVLLQFLVEAIVLSSLGGLIGLALGLAGSFGIGAALDLPIVLVPWVIALALGFSFGVGVVFGFVPARRAAALNPIEALRHE
jgi:putative ABC transport system permease protein